MSRVSPVSQSSRADWTLSRDLFLLEQLIRQQNVGKRFDAGWPKEAWQSVLPVFNKTFGVQNNVQQLKSRLSVLKKQYQIVKTLLDQGGFSWNDASHSLTAADDVWDQYILGHPEARPFRKMSFPLYDELGIIFDGKSAEGKGQISSILPEPFEDGTSASRTSQTAQLVTVVYPVTEAKEEHIEIFPSISGTAQTPFHIATDLPILEGDSENYESSSGKEIPLEDPGRNKRPAMPATTGHNKRGRMSARNRIADALQNMVLASERLTKEIENLPRGNDKFSYVKCLEELQQMKGLEESELVMAVQALKDEKNAVAFMTLKGPLRLSWLRSQCCKQ